jgi:hypothetical protein
MRLSILKLRNRMPLLIKATITTYRFHHSGHHVPHHCFLSAVDIPAQHSAIAPQTFSVLSLWLPSFHTEPVACSAEFIFFISLPNFVASSLR